MPDPKNPIPGAEPAGTAEAIERAPDEPRDAAAETAAEANDAADDIAKRPSEDTGDEPPAQA